MRIIGYYIHGNRQYVAFKAIEDGMADRYEITDGFHDRKINENNLHKFKGYTRVGKEEIDLDRIFGRMKGTRPWHPLLDALKKEIAA